jgi:hypothetical protein
MALTIAQIEALADRFDKRALAATIETDRSDFQLAFLEGGLMSGFAWPARCGSRHDI